VNASLKVVDARLVDLSADKLTVSLSLATRRAGTTLAPLLLTSAVVVDIAATSSYLIARLRLERSRGGTSTSSEGPAQYP
jgi:hypothetical protein